MPDRNQRSINLGFGDALGYAASDLISPAVARRAGALPDMELTDPPVTELRVHGVSGSNGPTMLEHPDVVQVAGDGTTMLYRRWNPAGGVGVGVPWKLEAYSWGGLTEAPLASAAWILLAPFMLFNVAHFALPAEAARSSKPVADGGNAYYLTQGRGRRPAQALLRLLALTATVEFTLALVVALLNTVAFQSGSAHFPSWLNWFDNMSVANRMRLAVAGIVFVLAALWGISVKTASKYEARTSQTRPNVDPTWAMTQTGFWQGAELVSRQRYLHSSAALAAVAIILSRPSAHMPTSAVTVCVLSSAVLAAVVVTTWLRVAERHTVTLQNAPRRQQFGRDVRTAANPAIRWCQALLVCGAIVLVWATFLGGWTDPKSAPATLPGLTNFCAFTLAAQALLIVVFAAFVAALYRSTSKAQRTTARHQGLVGEHPVEPSPDPRRSRADLTRPFFRGHLATLLVTLAVCVGGLLTALVVLFVTRLFGTPVPDGRALQHTPENALQIPWPVYALAAAPIGLVVGLILAGAWVIIVAIRDKTAFLTSKTTDPTRRVDLYYEAQAEPADARHDDPADFANARGRALNKVVWAWARGRLVDHAAVVFGCATAGMTLAIIVAVVAGERGSRHPLPQAFHGLAALESVVGLFVAGLLVGLLQSAYRNPAKRKAIGALWDVGTFWPRASHPFAPPCYAERAVPELVDRVRILTGTVKGQDGQMVDDSAWAQIEAHQSDVLRRAKATVPTGPLLLTGYSQGAAIAPAVIAQLPPETLSDVALLTLACPARRLYGRAFPGYFGPKALRRLADMLGSPSSAVASIEPEMALIRAHADSWPEGAANADDVEGPVTAGSRWRNVVRKTDYIGSWIFEDPQPIFTPEYLGQLVDQPCPDPAVLALDADTTPPPIHGHSDFFQDPFVIPSAMHLIGVLTTADGAAASSSASVAAQVDVNEVDGNRTLTDG
jgi:hypothetical protein